MDNSLDGITETAEREKGIMTLTIKLGLMLGLFAAMLMIFGNWKGRNT